MNTYKLPKHQVIARELFGDSKEIYEMERADLYQRLSRIMVEHAASELTDDMLAKSYKLGYQAQLIDALAGDDVLLDSFSDTVRMLRSI